MSDLEIWVLVGVFVISAFVTLVFMAYRSKAKTYGLDESFERAKEKQK